MAIEITRKELTAAALRAAAAKTKDSRAARRMLAIAFVLEGADRTTAATTCGMDRQTLRDWVHRYNAEGLAGLANRRSPGASPLLTPEQKSELAALVEAGPDLQRRRGCALATRRSSGADQGAVRRGDARTQRRQATGGIGLSAAVRAPAAPEVGPGGATGKGLGRRSGITIRSFSCALECKLRTVECLTLVGTEGFTMNS